MTNNLLDFFKSAYQNDSSCILVIDNMRRLVWHNGKHAPFEPDEDLITLLRFPQKGIVPSGDYSYSAHGIIYEYHVTNVSDEYYIISCSDIPAIYKHLENKYTRENLENALAESKSESLSIAASAAQLNDYFEEFEDDYIPSEKLNEQTNIIMQNCSRILKKQYLLEELLRYYSEDELDGSVLSCTDIIESFAKKCSRIIGPRGTTQIICDIKHDVYIYASWKRMEYLLLCVMVILRKKYSGVYQLKITSCQISDEAVINMKLIQTGDEEPKRPLLSEFIPLHRDIPVYEIEHMIIRKFLECYDGVIIDSTESGNKFISLRFPVAEIKSNMKLSAPRNGICNENVITPYHSILWEISDFRYY